MYQGYRKERPGSHLIGNGNGPRSGKVVSVPQQQQREPVTRPSTPVVIPEGKITEEVMNHDPLESSWIEQNGFWIPIDMQPGEDEKDIKKQVRHAFTEWGVNHVQPPNWKTWAEAFHHAVIEMIGNQEPEIDFGDFVKQDEYLEKRTNIWDSLHELQSSLPPS